MPTLPPEPILLDLHRRMTRVRLVEERIAAEYPGQEMRCPVHLHTGSEQVAAGVLAALPEQRVVFGSHRCHGPYLASGGSFYKMFAELHGLPTGCCGGHGGSMHLVDPYAGFLGSSGLVGGSVPIGAGYAQARPDMWVVVFAGDGALEEGVVSETIAYARARLPNLLLVIEDNGFSTNTTLRERPWNPLSVGEREGYSSALEVYERARRRAAGDGADVVLHARTCRWRVHVGYEPGPLFGVHDPIEELERILSPDGRGKAVAQRRALQDEMEDAWNAVQRERTTTP